MPAWVQHDGFVMAGWMEPADFGADPWVAESRGRARWIKARVEWLDAHPDVFDILLAQLREMARRVP